MTLYEFFEKPSVRYPLLSFISALALSTSLTTLPLLAACGASLGVSILVSMGVRIGMYLKEIGDEAKGTFTELKETIKNVKETTEKVSSPENLKTLGKMLDNMTGSAKELEVTLKEFKLTAKALTDNLAFDEKKGEKPLTRQVNKTLADLDTTIKKVNEQLGEGEEGATPTLLQTAKRTIEQVNKTVGDVDSAIEQARVGKVGWALGLSKAKDPAKKVTKPVAKKSDKVEADKAPVDKQVATENKATVEQTPGWFSNPLTKAYWGIKPTAANETPTVAKKSAVNQPLIPATNSSTKPKKRTSPRLAK